MNDRDSENSEWMEKKARDNVPAGSLILSLSTREEKKYVGGVLRPQVFLEVAYEYGGKEYRVTLSAHRQKKPKGFKVARIKG